MATEMTVNYSNVKGGSAAAHSEAGCVLNWERGNIGENANDDPCFVDPNNADPNAKNYGLMPNSPCIDAGDPNEDAGGGSETDVHGDPRKWGNDVDMGSDEVMRVYLDQLPQGQSEVLVLGGGGEDPNKEALLRFENISGPDTVELTVTKMEAELHEVDMSKYEALMKSVIVETSLAKGEYMMTMSIPINEKILKEKKPFNVSPMFWNESESKWKHAAKDNSTASDIREKLWLERYPGDPQPTHEELSLRGLGAHGVWWDSVAKEGFVWGNIDHASDFQAMVHKAGDFDTDGYVDGLDLAWFVTWWLETDCSLTGDFCGGAALNDDEYVDFADYCIFTEHREP